MKKGRRRFLRLRGVAVFLLVLVALVTALAADYGSSVIARDREGAVVARAPLPGSGRFEIEYVHSYYDTPAAEHFVADRYGGFLLVGVSSPDEAVLDYYELEGRKEEVADGSLRLVPERPPRFETLHLIATETGRRTLVVSGERFPLYAESGPVHMTIRIEEDTLLSELGGALAP